MNSRITTLHRKYLKLSRDKTELLTKIDEAEIAESVYNSNAIENSTLTLAETEKILLEEEVGREANLREVYLRANKNAELNVDLIFKLHEIFIGNIDPAMAGRFRQKESKINNILENYFADTTAGFIEKIAKFHLDFELVHPFVDGNGRIGRTLINIQLAKLKFPQITIRSKDKDHYHLAFITYQNTGNIKNMTNIITLLILESLHKRLAYLQDVEIINLRITQELTKNLLLPYLIKLAGKPSRLSGSVEFGKLEKKIYNTNRCPQKTKRSSPSLF